MTGGEPIRETDPGRGDPSSAALRRRHHVTESGNPDGPALLFSHGYATNQGVWRHVAPAFEDRNRVILFDHIGSGRSDRGAYDPNRHRSLRGFADDVIELVEGLGLAPVVFIGHSVSAMIGALAVGLRPELFDSLVMVGASARYLDDEGYVGGFSRAEAESVLNAVDEDFSGWAEAMAPHLVGADTPAAVAAELTELMTETTDTTAAAFAHSFLLADHREELDRVVVPALVMQNAGDPMVPLDVGRYIESRLPEGQLVQLAATGHFPTLSAPSEVIVAIDRFLHRRRRDD